MIVHEAFVFSLVLTKCLAHLDTIYWRFEWIVFLALIEILAILDITNDLFIHNYTRAKEPVVIPSSALALIFLTLGICP